MFVFYTIIALVAGVALASQAAINSQLAKAMGNEPLVATFISFGTGTLLLLVLSLLKTDLIGHLSSATQHAWWKYIGGALGALVVFTTILLSPKMGITNMLFFIIVGQLIAAMVIDHYGLIHMPVREVNLFKFIGIAIVGIGLIIFFFGDKFMKLFQ
ncbi:DMT family transporter [Pasteurella multocida]|uniref:DMT family transporter n=1 Tax=Pasteurella multocida TaxID=747 RepID=A0AAW8V6S6_PASMD|nr:DMT family transporter [Pasteurella multocida]MDH7437530.1 DMT family transporter [Pasteurella multocida]MDH7438682.1 DMT family transporter [Pasteurella multocida]MDT3452110.1 DMT family transporter [Pasteurella multocida]MDY0432880.1 DMT family transporter [Pasteurella multocida]MDY0436817.1 DMT family transporter [Pasteurella multocida]